MNNQDFVSFWLEAFPDTLPIPAYFKYDFPDSWFRVLSLDSGARAPRQPEDWDSLLKRQGEVLSAIAEPGAEVFLLVADYAREEVGLPGALTHPALQGLHFERLDAIDLYAVSPDEFKPGQFFRMACCAINYNREQVETILRACADDTLKAFFFRKDKPAIVSPFLGGLDVVVMSRPWLKSLKDRFDAYISKRAGGF